MLKILVVKIQTKNCVNFFLNFVLKIQTNVLKNFSVKNTKKSVLETLVLKIQKICVKK